MKKHNVYKLFGHKIRGKKTIDDEIGLNGFLYSLIS